MKSSNLTLHYLNLDLSQVMINEITQSSSNHISGEYDEPKISILPKEDE